MAMTLPDTRRSSMRNFFPITFIGSILWIAVFSYLMVWWATISGDAFSIPPEVMKIGGFPIEIKTKLRYLIICCYPIFEI